jgi:hypothetical protein
MFYAPSSDYCPVRAVQDWLTVLDRSTGPLFTRMSRGTSRRPAQPGSARLSNQSVNDLVQRHLGAAYTAHSLRASFVTVAVEAGQSTKPLRIRPSKRPTLCLSATPASTTSSTSMPPSTSAFNKECRGCHAVAVVTSS